MNRHTFNTPAPVDAPLGDTESLLERARLLIGRGQSRRIWLLLLDDDNVQLPALPQVDHIPVTPDAQALDNLRSMLATLGAVASQVAVVFERPGAPHPSPDDHAWCDILRRSAKGQEITLRAAFLAHGSGVDSLWVKTESH